jgi:hypothetical protein
VAALAQWGIVRLGVSVPARGFSRHLRQKGLLRCESDMMTSHCNPKSVMFPVLAKELSGLAHAHFSNIRSRRSI